jgi:hypothetical protein
LHQSTARFQKIEKGNEQKPENSRKSRGRHRIGQQTNSNCLKAKMLLWQQNRTDVRLIVDRSPLANDNKDVV